MADFVHTKFRMADDTSYIMRSDMSHSGCPVIFRVSGADLSTFASGGQFPNFDVESDKILEGLDVSAGTEQIYFQWVGSGFHRM